MQDWSHIIYSLFNGGATQATKIYSKVRSQHLHWGSEENYKKPDRSLLPNQYFIQYLPNWGYHLPQLAQIKIYYFTFSTSNSHNSLVSTVTRQWVGQKWNHGSIFEGERHPSLLQNAHTGPDAHPTFYWTDSGGKATWAYGRPISPPTSAEIKNEWSYVHTSQHAFKEGTRETLLYFAYYINRIHTYILKLTLNSNSFT